MYVLNFFKPALSLNELFRSSPSLWLTAGSSVLPATKKTLLKNNSYPVTVLGQSPEMEYL
jgi:hypothetical protein